jgi:hypothetical protein
MDRLMYDAGKVLVAGGADPPTNTAEVIDLNAERVDPHLAPSGFYELRPATTERYAPPGWKRAGDRRY